MKGYLTTIEVPVFSEVDLGIVIGMAIGIAAENYELNEDNIEYIKILGLKKHEAEKKFDNGKEYKFHFYTVNLSICKKTEKNENRTNETWEFEYIKEPRKE